MTKTKMALAKRRDLLAFLTASLIFLSLALYAGALYGRLSATEELKRQGATEASLKVALLRAVLERPRTLPLVLSEDHDIRMALATVTPDRVLLVNRKLEGLVSGSQVSVIYVIDASGKTIASSNWRQKDSFVGSNYAFRDYFRIGMRSGVAEQFALGNVSKKPGLYISRRVDADGRALGVVVVKMEFDRLESDWRDGGRTAFVTDWHGVALISTLPQWRFRTTGPLPDPVRKQIRERLDFGDAALSPLPLERDDRVTGDAAEVRATLPDGRTASFLRLRTQAATTPWVLDYLVPTDPVPSAVRQNMLGAFALCLPLIVAGGVLVERRRRARARLEAAQARRAELEERVAARTRDLTLARDRLEAEVAMRESTEQRLQLVQQDLVAANRLAILGQVAAGVAHEINQPVATIRAYADNARTFLDRDRKADAGENLSAIARLTERIGAITEDLKALARKGRTSPEPVNLGDAMDGAVMLLRSRFASRLDALSIRRPSEDLTVLAHRIRLEQVLINLMQNALEALGDDEGGKVTVAAEDHGDHVDISVSDTGPGIAPEILQGLFTPFNTSKPQGLGLGLVISKDIVADFGGALDVESTANGARFTITLRKA